MDRPRRASPRPPSLRDVPMSEALRQLAQRSEPHLYPAGRMLIQEGDTGGTLYLILSGRLRAFSSNAEGTRRITYGEYRQGEFLGEMSLDGGPRSSSVEAVDPSWCVLVTRPLLLQHIAEHPDFAFELLAKVIRRARMATLSLRAVALNDVYGRVVGFLNERASPNPDGSRGVGPITQQDMADALGCTRPMISRVMKELQRGAYLRSDRHAITLLRALPARF